MPFRHIHDKIRHFNRHGDEVGAKTADEYEKMAEDFMKGPQQPGVRECTRPVDNALIRFNPQTIQYGVMSSAGVIITYMLCIVPPTSSDTPTQYFERDCNKKKVN